MKIVLLLFLTVSIILGQDCSYPGGTLTDGESGPVFNSDTPCDECSNHIGNVTCIGGSLSGAVDYLFGSCETVVCTCTTTGGATVQDGDTAIVFSQASPCDPCTNYQGSVSCTHGSLSGDTGYQYDGCNQATCPCTTTGGASVQPGDSATVYADGTACNCADVAGSVTCSYGTLDGDTTYGFDSCSTITCTCEFLGQFIADGGSLTVYANATDCDSCMVGSVFCDTGTLSGDTTYGATSCSVVS